MKYQIENLGCSASGHEEENVIDVDSCLGEFARLEDDVLHNIIFECEQAIDQGQRQRDRSDADHCFGRFTSFVLKPYVEAGMVSRAAAFSANKLIPELLDLEGRSSFQFHKGALFYDTALAFLLMGDEARFEYYLAMTDEEDYLTHGIEGKTQERGMHNKKQGELSSQTIASAVDFAIQFGNGTILTSACPVKSVLGSELSSESINNWRAGLDVFHHAELFRSLNELRIFCGEDVPHYPAVRDNPYVMLRLGKVLAHVAQWSESQLTLFQTGVVIAKTLHPKLATDPHLSSLVSVAGKDSHGNDLYPGKSATGTDVDTQLKSLLSQIRSESAADEKAWRVLRVFYIIRNSTAHQIESSLNFYTDRQYLLDLLQVTFVAALLIQQRKGSTVV